MLHKLKILSYPMDNKTPVYGGRSRPKISPKTQTGKGDNANTYEINIHNHTGTHVDAPCHFIESGRRISDYSLEELTFNRPVVVDIPKKSNECVERTDLESCAEVLKGADCLLIRTGFGRFRGKEEYETRNPGVSPEAITWVRKNFPEIRCMGIDSISISGFQDRGRGRKAHRAAFREESGLGEPLLVLEDLNLDGIEDVKKLIVIPWQISGIDSAPCTVLAD
jgi:kynurenine formamidase